MNILQALNRIGRDTLEFPMAMATSQRAEYFSMSPLVAKIIKNSLMVTGVFSFVASQIVAFAMIIYGWKMDFPVAIILSLFIVALWEAMKWASRGWGSNKMVYALRLASPFCIAQLALGLAVVACNEGVSIFGITLLVAISAIAAIRVPLLQHAPAMQDLHDSKE